MKFSLYLGLHCFCCTILRDVMFVEACSASVISTTCILQHAVVCWVTACLNSTPTSVTFIVASRSWWQHVLVDPPDRQLALLAVLYILRDFVSWHVTGIRCYPRRHWGLGRGGCSGERKLFRWWWISLFLDIIDGMQRILVHPPVDMPHRYVHRCLQRSYLLT
jgi:hypothetical protein